MSFDLDKKAYYPVSTPLRDYLKAFQREQEMAALYRELRHFNDRFPLYDANGVDTLWKTVVYDSVLMRELGAKLASIYSILKTGDTRATKHLTVGRIDYCEFGNSRPFRVRIVNQFNDNYDHIYIKIADSNRIFGLELEHILSPNRIGFLVHGDTLVEEHIAGVPGDVFLRDIEKYDDFNVVRLAKEFVKFSERSFIRLLGDLRSYNYVVDITPDFEQTQFRVRAIDFDQQTYEGHLKLYQAQFFKENRKVVNLCASHINYPTMQQYQNEERSLVKQRLSSDTERFEALIDAMEETPCSTPEKIAQLSKELEEYHNDKQFRDCKSMPQIVQANINAELAITES
jgi:hypothetical protein